ncbi:MAG: AraC family transcriptional regulator [Clostridia bacterium]|nr:AraC family transcriptional regulator [Clostridia bacterium]
MNIISVSENNPCFYVKRFDEIKKDSAFYCHDTFLICYCQRGNFTHYLEKSSATLYHGDILILPPNTLHKFQINTPQTVIYTMSFPYDYITSACSENSFIKSLESGDNIHAKLVLPPEEIVLFECLLDRIADEWEFRNPCYEEIIKHALSVIITILSRVCRLNSRDTLSQTYQKGQLLKHCVSYIDAHCTKDISLDEITRMSSMSRAVFCSLFKKETGLSFKAYLNRKRIQKAMALIKSGEKITTVATLCGYREFSTFYRNFIKYTSTTPVKYQNISNKKNLV